MIKYKGVDGRYELQTEKQTLWWLCRRREASRSKPGTMSQCSTHWAHIWSKESEVHNPIFLASLPSNNLRNAYFFRQSLVIFRHFLSLWCHSYNHSQNIWDWLLFSCEIAYYRKSLISVFQEFFASIKKILIMGGRLSTRLSFYEI